MHPLFSITSIGVCLVASVDLARCDEQSPRLAFSRELELLDQQSKVDGESADQLFTIKIFKKTNVGGEPRFVHLICESLGDKAAVIVLSDAGEPYAYLGNEGVYVISAESAQTLFWYPGLHFRLGIVDPEHFLKLNFSGKLERSACQFDIFRWGHALLGMNCTASYSRESHVYEFNHESSATFKIRFNAAGESEPLPRISVTAEDQEGKGYEICDSSTDSDNNPSIIDLERPLLQRTDLNVVVQTSEKNLRSLLPLHSAAEVLQLMDTEEAKATAAALQLTFGKHLALPSE
jgi:hypothetical protein